ncbi:hypothetical protein HPB52_014807 [Rhipicephalus sanguineus]|uniref:Endonuclease/exonuclease/phosphatase domain-containing protein n=1 Tax=Rhipicephalus sanguineus TaxID=34632 RepID=A0A9D4PG64_RHISA|nr:hypothetical protein HPB52_014807 [Rhipicephalus sanguineus]
MYLIFRAARLDRVYVTSSLRSAVVDCQAVDPPSYALGISDHRPVAVTLEVKDRSPYRHPWRVDNRLFSDETARASLRNPLAASTGDRSWDALKQVSVNKSSRHRLVDSVCILGISYRASGATSGSWEEEVKELKQQVTRALEFNFPYYVRRYLLMGVFTDTYALKTTLRVLQLPEEHPARKLATYFVGVQSRLFLQTQPPGPKAINPTPFYRHVIGIYKRIAQLNLDTPLLECRNTELAQELLVNSGCEAKNPGFPWVLLTPSWLPGSIQDVVWRFGWSVLPTADRMYKWHYVRSEHGLH